MRNVFAGLLLAFSSQQFAWTILDYHGLKQYGADGWPYELNPILGGIFALAALILSLTLIEKKSSICRATAIALATFSGVYFWVKRSPANPYRDYGEDNSVHMILSLLFIGITLLVVFGIESLTAKKPSD